MGCMRASQISVPRRNDYFSESAPALAICASWEESTPDTPMPNDLAVDHDGDAALERRRAFQLQDAQPSATAGDDVLEGLGGPTEAHRRRGLPLGDVDAPVLRVVEALERDEMPTAVNDGDDDVPVVLLGLGLRGRHGLLVLIEGDRRPVGRRRGR